MYEIEAKIKSISDEFSVWIEKYHNEIGFLIHSGWILFLVMKLSGIFTGSWVWVFAYPIILFITMMGVVFIGTLFLITIFLFFTPRP